MSITKIHPVTDSIASSVAYICKPAKTMNRELIYSYGCTPANAAYQFDYALSKAREAKNKGFHLIQSFAPGEVDEQLAHQLGKELAEAVLGSRYSYVIATHNDRGHIHNHIVFCAVSNIDHKRYHDCKESYRQIRKCNDQISRSHNLSVIEEKTSGRKKSHSYAEWEKEKEGTSWKSKLRNDIRECLQFCPSWESFLKRMKEHGYEMKNVDPAEGKYISFRAPGQEKWIRGRETTLGKEFTREGIQASISEYAQGQSASRTSDKITGSAGRDREKIEKYIDTGKAEFQEKEYLKAWADRENLKRLAHNYSLLHRRGFSSISELKEKLSGMEEQSEECRWHARSLEQEAEKLAGSISAMEQYLEFRPCHQKYRSATNKEAIFQKYEYELTLFEGARNSLKEEGILLRNVTPEAVDQAKEKYHQLLHKKAEYLQKMDQLQKEEKDLRKLQEEIRKGMEKDDVQEKQEKQEQKKKKEQHI